jgi:hypothetical protein
MFNFKSMIKEFAVPIEVQTTTGVDGGHYNDAGEYVANTGTKTLKLDEPLIPPTQQMLYSYTEGGEADVYDLDWYSEQSGIAVETIVKEVRTGQEYRVAGATDYQAFAGITIYHLKAVS